MRSDVHFENDEFPEHLQLVPQIQRGRVAQVRVGRPRGLPLVAAERFPQGSAGLRRVLAAQRHVTVQHRQVRHVRAVLRDVLYVGVDVVLAPAAVRPPADGRVAGRTPRGLFVFRVVPHEHEAVRLA